jgi:hypothetical protein
MDLSVDDVSPSEALGSQWEYIFACLPLDLSLFGEAELSINNNDARVPTKLPKILWEVRVTYSYLCRSY